MFYSEFSILSIISGDKHLFKIKWKACGNFMSSYITKFFKYSSDFLAHFRKFSLKAAYSMNHSLDVLNILPDISANIVQNVFTLIMSSSIIRSLCIIIAFLLYTC